MREISSILCETERRSTGRPFEEVCCQSPYAGEHRRRWEHDGRRKDAKVIFEIASSPLLRTTTMPVPIDARAVMELDENKERATEFHLIVSNVESQGARKFLAITGIEAYPVLADLTAQVHAILYPPGLKLNPPPIIHSISLHVRSFPGIAFTDLCNPPPYYQSAEEEDGEVKDKKGGNHRAIHLSTDYIQKLEERVGETIRGVLLQLLVYCYVNYGREKTCPKAVVTGIANYVRLKSGIARPPWEIESMGATWDTGSAIAYFLDYLSLTFLPNLVPLVNLKLKTEKWEDGKCLRELLGVNLEELWMGYRAEGKGKVKELMSSPIKEVE